MEPSPGRPERSGNPASDEEGDTTMRFMMIMFPGEMAETGILPDAKLFAAMMKYNEDLQKAGVLLALEGLHPSAKGARVSFRGGRPEVTAGPFSGARDLVGGFWLIQVDSKEEAIAWASRCPVVGDEVIEIRQVYEASDFPAEAFPAELSERERALSEELQWRPVRA
jgi:hypothetical protein